MHIRVGYDLRFDLPRRATEVSLLEIHPSRSIDLCEPDRLHIEPEVEIDRYIDGFGNLSARFHAHAGPLRLWSSPTVYDSGEADAPDPAAPQWDISDLPPETLQYLLASRYCEVDLLSTVAWAMFGHREPGWQRVQAVCDWVHDNVHFGYEFARSTKTAAQVFQERNGVCRDFQHLAISFCRCLNIPARYATGYLGDIGVPRAPYPMDFNAWFEVYLGGRWWTVDARHNQPRIGRVLIARGRDATDVAITTTFWRVDFDAVRGGDGRGRAQWLR